ncbi:hypothetical protein EC973_008338 [Apophysomyces ossiformis]|uniref:F-box domain-containing protein n=1 Tax=Apophysomyces ossiformis TaxID=679940 RepID=A0A8H7BV91_9FUNG|nr:hypothetical protein EC973_008338 [Apophysomyces ossiformis]
MICVLPDELLLRILKFIDNPVDLAPLAITCQRFRRLVVDWSIWSGTIGVEAGTSHAANALAVLAEAFTQASEQRTTALTIAAKHNYSSIPRLFDTFLLSQHSSYLRHIELYAPIVQHTTLLKSLSKHPFGWTECTIRDPRNDYAVFDLNAKDYLLRWLETCRTTAEVLELPACPSNWLMMIHGPFSNLHTLALALEPLETTTTNATAVATGSDSQRYWERFREQFPQLRHLTLHLTQDNAFPLFKSLLSNRSLFPWIERITIVSQEDPKKFIQQHELHVGLMRLDGLLRITAGWDLIALDINA